MNAVRTAELDLAIANMDTVILENQVKSALQELSGIKTVRLQERGALVHYNPSAITKDDIAKAVRQAGFRVTIFQDSASGETHEVSF